jgi:hypothetical protein
MITVQDAFALVQYTAEESRALDKLENRIDAELAQRFDGAPIRLQFPGDDFTPKFVAAVQRRYEERGGWRVVTDIKANAFSFLPMHLPPAPGAKAKAPERSLPRVASMPMPSVSLSSGHHLLVRMPTRGRPAQALEVLACYRALSGIPVTIEVVIDADDETMLRAEVLQRLRALDCVICVGHHASKVEAVNGGRIENWDILLLASDDMVPVAEGYAAVARNALVDNFPLLDGCVYFDDGYQHDNIVTLPIMGRRLYDHFGYVYHPAYKSLWCDQEQTDVLRAMGRLAYVNKVLIEHRHHVTGLSKVDETYKRNDALWEEDKAVYERRKLARVREPLRLSVLICTLPSRSALLDKLVDELYAQADSEGWDIEVIVDSRTNITVGAKRQALLERSRGDYVCFVDDDDWIAHDYVGRICRAIISELSPDCIAISGVMTTAGAVPEPFYNSIANTEWHSKDGAHYRTPTHLSPVKRELALQAGFSSMSYGEDHDYSQRLRPLLKTEASTGRAPLYFYFYQPKSDRKE